MSYFYRKPTGFYDLFFLAFITSSILGFILLQWRASIFDIILPKNETRPHRLLLPMEYFLDQEKYFYLILVHTNATIFLGTIIVVGILTLLFAFLEYICGVFAIAR